MARASRGNSTYPLSDRWVHRPDVWTSLLTGGVGVVTAFRPTLLPRSTQSQGAMAGVEALIGFGFGGAVHRVLAPAARTRYGPAGIAAVSALAVAQSRLPTAPDEPLPRATARSVAALAGAGGLATAAVHGVLRTERPVRTGLTVGAVALAAGAAQIAMFARRLQWNPTAGNVLGPRPLRAVRQAVQVAAGLGLAITAVRGSGGVIATTLQRRLGVARTPARVAGNVLSGAAWTAAVFGGVDVVRGSLAGYDRMLDPGYDRAPASPMCSGGPGSLVPWARLGRQGRRFVTTAATRPQIEVVLGRPATTEPIRLYVGYDAAKHLDERISLALAELERTGAYDRSVLVVVQPPGNGMVNTVAITAAEYATAGDIATVAVQFARVPSVLALRLTTSAAAAQRRLLEGIQAALADRPPPRRPRIVVYGESQGAWAGQDTFLHEGVAGFDRLGVDRALWVGTPAYSGWRREVRDGRVAVPPGAVVEVPTAADLLVLDDAARRDVRAVLLQRIDDPVGHLDLALFVRRPWWLTQPRPPGVPRDVRWRPFLTGIQTCADTLNAMQERPGELVSIGHTYKADLPLAAIVAWDLPRHPPGTLDRIHDAIRQSELERAAALKGGPAAAEPAREGELAVA